MKWWLEGVRKWSRKAVDVRVCGVCALAVSLAMGCATKGAELSANSPPEVKTAAVRERANARWAALIKGDMDAAYAYLSPGGRQMVSAEQYAARVRGRGFRDVQIDKVDCDAEICKVRLQLTYDYLPTKGGAAAKGIRTAVQETWVLEQGQAWFVLGP